MSINKFENSDEIIKDIFYMDCINSLSDSEKERLHTMLKRYRYHILCDIDIAWTKQFEILKTLSTS